VQGVGFIIVHFDLSKSVSEPTKSDLNDSLSGSF
jgi:hypothetical protein